MVSADLNGLATSVPATPTHKENRRRSWFGLVTPKRKERVASVGPPPTSNYLGPSSSVSGSESIEELEPSPPRPLHPTSDASSSRRQQEWHDTEDEPEGDMDSDMEGTVRRKRNPVMRRSDGNGAGPSHFKDSDSDTPVRMKDTTTLAILSRNNTVKPKPPTSRIFSRSASSQSSSSVDANPAPRPKTLANILTPSKVPIRSSSVNRSSPRLTQFDTPAAPSDGSPVNKHKPLPELPLQLDSIAASRAVSLPLSAPAPPTGIVVTPSSPCDKDPFDSLFGLGPSTPTPSSSFNPSIDEYPGRPASAPVSRNPSTRTASRNVSGGTITQSNASEQNSLGLGLPDGVSARRPVSSGDTLMPQRHVAVSAPLPDRSPSPSTKVTFQANEKPEHSGGKIAKPRPRSFSAMFTRSSQATEPITTDEDEPSSSKFGWLGVRNKTIRRRRSELKLSKKRSGFLSENERDTDASTQSNQDVSQALNRSTNASSPMLVNRSTPDVSRTPQSAASSSEQSVLPVIEQQAFWSAQEWAQRNTSLTDVGTPQDGVFNGDVKRDVPQLREVGLPRRLLEPASQRSSMGSNSPLGSLPETGPPPTIAEHGPSSTPPRLTPRPVGRGRSFSDAARRTQPEEVSLSSSHSSLRSPLEGDRPVTPSRPQMPSRSSSGGVAVLGKVRSVLFKSRPRSNSVLRHGGSADERELGPGEYGNLEYVHPRPASSASTSSFGPSPALPPVRIRPEDVPQVSSLSLRAGDDDRHVILCETPERSPRSSYAASFTSSLTTQSQRLSHTADPHSTLTTGFRGGRARAQTVSSAQGTQGPGVATTGQYILGPTHRSSHDAAIGPPSSFVATAFLQTPTTPTFPTAATPPRQRSGSIRRLSTGLFRSNPSSPKPPSGQLFPLPPRGPSTSSSGHVSPAVEEPPSRVASPLPLSRSTTPVKGSSLDEDITAVRDNDTPEAWLERLSGISRRELAGILAASSDEFHTKALQLYMRRFDFTHIALDVALRRLLMLMSLPKETQQIDRVIEAFATHYDNCEPGLFGSKDNAYVLAFSMMMLHTDAFNRHNKHKMSKADYVRNTRLDGVPEVVLEAIYDNITFTPFVFIEDDKEAAMAAAGNPTIHGHARSGKIDVYDLIVGGQLGSLRVDVERSIRPDSPFSCMGTRAFLDVDRLQRAFADAHPLHFVTSRPRRKSSATLTSQLADKNGAGPKSTPKEEVTTLKVTKVGLLSRKGESFIDRLVLIPDDTPTSKRTGARKWRSWSVVLTGSQLLFFKDTLWALTLAEQMRSSQKGSPESVPRIAGFQPDEVLSVKDSVAVFDRECSGAPHTFRFAMPGNRHYLLQATDEHQMNDWLTLINYASTFKTASIRMRATGMNSGDAVKAGATAAEEHRKHIASGSGSSGSGTPDNSTHVRSVLFSETQAPQHDDEPVVSARPKIRRVGSLRSSPAPIVDVSGANDVVVNGGEQMEAVIGSVKAELAAGRTSATRNMSIGQGTDAANQTHRTRAIQARVDALRTQASAIEQRLTASLRIARNLAVLTPFQKSTRERIEAAVPDLAASIRADRLELSKLHLWITMLLKDLDRDQRDWARVRQVALQAATRSLNVPTGRADRRATIGVSAIEIPKLSLPEDHGQWTESALTQLSASPLTPGELPVTNPVSDDEQEPRRSSTSEPQSERTSGSDYELAPEYISGSSESLRDEMERQLAFSASPEPGATPKAAFQPQLQEQLDTFSTPMSTKTEMPKNGGDSRDQPEHWRNTRAATKVSLAHMPRSSIGELSRKFIKVEDNVVAGANGSK